MRAGLFLLPLVYTLDTYDQYVLPKLLAARALLLGLLLVLALRAATEGGLRLRRTSLDVPLLAFLASAVLSTVFAFNVNVGIFGTYSRYDGLLTTLTYLALFWAAVQSIEGPDDARALVRTVVGSAYVVALVALGQALFDTYRLGSLQTAIGSLGNQNVTGAFLAMACPLAYLELTAASTWAGRVITANALFVVVAALVLTFSRSAWLGGGVAAGVIAFAGRQNGRQFGLAAGVVALAAVVVVSGLVPNPLTTKLEHRFASLWDPANSWGPRLPIWKDSLQLIASRPILGYGPDNVGLVYPRFQTGEWAMATSGSELQVDKTHAEVLQVAATQGVVGALAYLVVLAAFIRSFWRSPRDNLSTALFAGWVAYQVTVQLNFTALAAAFPFWILAAVSVTTWEAEPPYGRLAVPAQLRRPITALAAVLVAAVAIVGVVLPYLADSSLRDAVDRNAQMAADRARALSPFESVYAVEMGNLAYERGDWTAAKSQYEAAAALGTYNPRVYRSLALADIQLGLRGDALIAARRAVELDRFDPANQALVNELEAGGRNPLGRSIA